MWYSSNSVAPHDNVARNQLRCHTQQFRRIWLCLQPPKLIAPYMSPRQKTHGKHIPPFGREKLVANGLRSWPLQTFISGKAIEAGERNCWLPSPGSNPHANRGVTRVCSINNVRCCNVCPQQKKKDGGVRLIVVIITLRRLATKVEANTISVAIEDALRPVQLGVLSKDGFAAAARATRRYLGEALHGRANSK